MQELIAESSQMFQSEYPPVAPLSTNDRLSARALSAPLLHRSGTRAEIQYTYINGDESLASCQSELIGYFFMRVRMALVVTASI
jgi:hypothetical protein